REQPVSALVQADRQDVWIALKYLLHAVAVVDVHVDVGDAVALLLKPCARDGGVVVGAESGRPVPVRVMQPARRAEGVERGTSLDCLSGDEGRADPQRSAFMKRVRDRIVGGCVA